MRSCAVPASRVSGTSSKVREPPLPPPAACHSAAMASASGRPGISSLVPPGMRIGFWSSSTAKPPSPAVTLAWSQNRFITLIAPHPAARPPAPGRMGRGWRRRSKTRTARAPAHVLINLHLRAAPQAGEVDRNLHGQRPEPDFRAHVQVHRLARHVDGAFALDPQAGGLEGEAVQGYVPGLGVGPDGQAGDPAAPRRHRTGCWRPAGPGRTRWRGCRSRSRHRPAPPPHDR